ncbi:MAG TPA: alanine racemase [Pseudorhodoplanes sp.]|nr:alanine racemase [Pseudorhodoplanes sp.]
MDSPVIAPMQISPQLPNEPVATPCFVIYEDGVRHNLQQTVKACGGIERLMPHVKTHRSPWITELCIAQGVTAFKCATNAEVEMVLAAGAKKVTWSYPTVNPVNVHRFVEAARRYSDAKLTGLVDSERGLEVWRHELRDGPPNVDLRVDLDPGLHRTGAPMTDAAIGLARGLHGMGRLAGWHIYDGHVKGNRAERQAQVDAIAEKVRALQAALAKDGIATDAVAGGSYTFNLWPRDLARYVSPGSWTYSSAQHDIELADLGWVPAAFVLSTVMSTHQATVTLDAGAKAVSPDKPLAERFRWADGRIVLMNEEHTVVESARLAVGDRVLLMPMHACTTAYLYPDALVKTSAGRWEHRPQLGSLR